MCYGYELGVDLNVISRVFAFVKYVASLYCTLYVFNELIFDWLGNMYVYLVTLSVSNNNYSYTLAHGKYSKKPLPMKMEKKIV